MQMTWGDLDDHDRMAKIRGYYTYECQVNDCDCTEELTALQEEEIED